MKPQKTKFTFVYNEIRQCILEGQISPGNVLPSSRMYCEQFHVSRYMINRVFDVLRAEGLVDIQPHLAPIIVSKKDFCNSSNIAFEILRQRESILQLYQTLALILSSLMIFSLQGRDVEMMPHYKQAMKVLRLGDASGEWSSPSKLGYDILKIDGNSLFNELYSTFDLYNKLAFFAEDCSYFSKRLLHGSVSVVSVTIDTLRGGEPLIKYNQLSDMHQKLTDFIEHTLNYLSEITPKCPVRTGLKFSWNPMHGQDYYYLKIVDDMNPKIGPGEHSIRICPPYEKQLANQYDVSLLTVRKALLGLEQRGLVKKSDDKDTIVIEPGDTKLHQLALNPGYVEKALCYLHALQLTVLIIRSAALAAAVRFTREKLDELTDRFTPPGFVYLADVQEAVSKHTTLGPLHVILPGANHLLEWGHHFAHYLSKRYTLSHLSKKTITALRQLHEGNASSFVDGMADCHRYTLICMKKNMAEKYKFHNVANIRVSEKYQSLATSTRKEYTLRLLKVLPIPSLVKNV